MRRFKNVVTTAAGATCTVSSYYYTGPCIKALGNPGKWTASGSGVGHWFRVSLPKEYHVRMIGITPSKGKSEQADQYTFTMANGYKNTVSF